MGGRIGVGASFGLTSETSFARAFGELLLSHTAGACLSASAGKLAHMFFERVLKFLIHTFYSLAGL